MTRSATTSKIAFGSFVDALREAEKILTGHPQAGSRDMADAYTYLAGQISFQIERHFKGGDRDRPCFVRMMDSYRSAGNGTLNHHYYLADIDGRGQYRIVGNRGNLADICFEVLSGIFGDDREPGERLAALSMDELVVDPDGRFEIHIGGSRRSGNWMPTDEHARTVFVRQTVSDWTTEQPTPMLIERVGKDVSAFSRPSDDDIARRYSDAAKGILEQIGYLQEFSQNWLNELPTNALTPPTVGPTNAGYHPNQFNTLGQWRIGADEALVVSFEPPSAGFQSVDITNALWFNQIYPRSVTSTLTNAQATTSSDGVQRFVISATDPAVNNWLDTAGLTEGFLTIRWQRVTGRPPQRPRTEVASIADVRAHFPDDEPMITPHERARSSHLRQLAMDRRYF